MRIAIVGPTWPRGNIAASSVASGMFESGWDQKMTELVWGGKKGIDTAGYIWTMQNKGYYFPTKAYSDIKVLSKQADGLLAIWDGKSKRTARMIIAMNKLDKPIWIIIIPYKNRK